MLVTTVESLAGLDDAELTERFRSLELGMRSAEVEMAAVIAEGKRRAIHTVDGHRSMKGWLRANANWSDHQVMRRLRLAQVVADVPVVGRALAAGHIGVAQTDELARIRSNPRCGARLVESIEVLLDHAEHLSFGDFRVCARRWELLADLDGAHHERELNHDRRTATVIEVDGSLYLNATGGTSVDAAEMKAVFDRFVEAEFQVDVAERTRLHGADAPASLLSRTDAQRRFDAIKMIFRKAVSVPADAVEAVPLVNYVIDARTFEEGLADHGFIPLPVDLPTLDLSERRCETSTGVVVLPDDVIRAALHGHIRRVLMNSAGVIVAAGRKRRLFTGAAREAAKLMARHCDFPGCAVGAEHAQVDHLDEWVRHQGRTDTTNAGIECNSHNILKHQGYRAVRDPKGRVIFHRPDGTPMLPVGRRYRSREPDDLVDDQTEDIELLTQLALARVAALRPAM